MNEELKAFVQAYIDGEDVEYINHYENNNEYSKVTSLATFEYPTLVFRIKPKAEDKWQRVIDEGYLCKFWDNKQPTSRVMGRLIDKDKVLFCHENGAGYQRCEVLREKGIKQPYFQGDDIPTHWAVLVYFKNNHHLYRREVSYLDNIDWSEVVAYIEV